MRDLFIMKRSELKRALIHVPVGVVAMLFGTLTGWWAAIIFSAGFLAYELNEDRHLTDQAWIDLKGFLWGVVLYNIGYIVL